MTTTPTTATDAAGVKPNASRALTLFERSSSLTEKAVVQQYDKWVDNPKGVGKARKNWPIYMGCVLAAHEYCGVTSPTVAATAIQQVLDQKPAIPEVTALLAGEIPSLWKTDVVRNRFREALPQGMVSQAERVSIRFMDLTGMNDAAVAKCRQGHSFGAGGREHHWLGCILKETAGYADAVADITPGDMMQLCFRLRRSVWELANEGEKLRFYNGELPPRWKELATVEGLSERPPRWDPNAKSEAPPPEPPPADDPRPEPPPIEEEHKPLSAPPPEPPPAEYIAERDETFTDWANNREEEEEELESPAMLSRQPSKAGMMPNQDGVPDVRPVRQPVVETGMTIYRDDPIPEVPQLTDEQLAIRKTGITATDISAIMNHNPWRTAYNVWEEKTSEVDRWEPELRQLIGLVVEKPVIRLYLQDYPDHGEVKRYGTIKSPKNPIKIATPDATVGDRLLEVKSTGYLWTDVPIYYISQVNWQFDVLRDCAIDLQDIAHLPTLSATYMGFQLDTWEIEIDEALISRMNEEAERFWEMHVVRDIPPEVVAADIERVNKQYPVWDPRSDLITANEEAERLFRLLPEFLEEREIADQAVQKIFAKLKMIIQTNYGIVFEDGHKMTWKNNKDKVTTKWKGAFQDLRERMIAAGMDAATVAKIADEVQEAHTTRGPGARPFLSNWTKLIPEDLR